MIYLSVPAYDSVDQGTWVITINGNFPRNCYLENTSEADGDGVSFKEYMPAGTYTCKMRAFRNPDHGIMNVNIDGDTVVTWDQYASGWSNPAYKTQTGITVSTGGIKTIQVIANGKNASSSAYRLVLSELIFYRTA